MKKPMIFRDYLYREKQKGEIPGEMVSLMGGLSVACKRISHDVSQGALMGTLGSAGTENIQGEIQKELDIIANDVMMESLLWTERVRAVASEEMDDVEQLSIGKGNYLLVFDPLDGSSNIDVNISVGTIFSVLRSPEGVDKPTKADFMQPGTEQVAAGYVVYGTSTIMVLTLGNEVNGFTLDRDIGSFVLTHPGMRIPEETNEFSINASNSRAWEPAVSRYIDECVEGESGPLGKKFNMRWVGSMVADVHRLMYRGGIFLYPKDPTNKKRPGKLRLLYEANPISFLVEQAGGVSSTGYGRLMEVQPVDLHERVPVIMGSKVEVERVVGYHSK